MALTAREAYGHLYRTARWQRLREQVIIDDEYTCRMCGALVGLKPYDAHVDHIDPHKGDEALFWATANLQTLCGPCHNSAKARMEHGKDVTTFTADGRPEWPE